MSNNRTSWDGFWSESDTTKERDVYSIINEAKFEHLRKIIPNKGFSLEVGAGTAHTSAHLAAWGLKTTCLDYSEEALKRARENYQRRGLKGKFIRGDAFNLPFIDNTFDLVLSTGLLEHYDDPSRIVREMVRVLKPGGVFYSDIVPEKFSLLRAFSRWRRPMNSMDDFYERGFSKEEIERLLMDAKLNRVMVFPAGVYPPELPLLHRLTLYRGLERWFLESTAPFWRRLDNTRIAEWLGFYYFTYGFKKGR